jgi:L-lactate utilization protein LutC
MASLAETFVVNAKEAAAVVEHVAPSPGAVRVAVDRAVQGAAKIVLGGYEFLSIELWAVLSDLPGVISQPSDAQLSTADVGISSAFAGVASSGSVCIAMGPPFATAASLLMPLHIVLLQGDRIIARPRDLFDPANLGGEGLRRNVVLVTGPSATADMGPLVRGVHGPHRLHVLLLE